MRQWSLTIRWKPLGEKNTWKEPSYDSPNASKPRDQDHEDESTAAPKSIDQDRKIVPFRKKAVRMN